MRITQKTQIRLLYEPREICYNGLEHNKERGLISMRMRKKTNLIPRMEACRDIWIRQPQDYRGRWRELYPEARELRLEVGCGKGKFTAETAAAEPDILLVAMERVPEAMVMAMEKVKAMGLTNVFFIGEDVAQVEELFAPEEVDLLYINFCDPWPHKKHAPRRLTHEGFLKRYQQVLRPGGEIHFKTDNAGLFEFSLEQFQLCGGYTLKNITHDLHRDGPVGIMTGYEEKFYGLGTPICRLEAVFTGGTT